MDASTEQAHTQRLERFVTAMPSEIASYLDQHWGAWRLGEPSTDLILYPPPVGPPLMVGPADGERGVLVIDGERYYSAAWL